MVSLMSLLFDLSDPDLHAKLDQLETTPGYCILVDRVGSTALKDQPPRAWLSRIHDTFALVKSHLLAFQPLKIMGDALMYYIPESGLLETAPGYCILVDRVGSTALKDQPPRAWLSR